MTYPALLMKRWLLWGGVPAAALGLLWPLYGWAGMLGWLLLGLLSIVPGSYPYPRKRGVKPRQLLFALSAGALCMAGLQGLLPLLCGRPMGGNALPDYLLTLSAAFWGARISAGALGFSASRPFALLPLALRSRFFPFRFRACKQAQPSRQRGHRAAGD